jgi:hypothetical protein
MAPVIENIRRRVDNDNMLTAPFTKEEFRVAAFSMHPDKCPGPDGYNPDSINTSGLFAAMISSKTVVIGLILANFPQPSAPQASLLSLKVALRKV